MESIKWTSLIVSFLCTAPLSAACWILHNKRRCFLSFAITEKVNKLKHFYAVFCKLYEFTKQWPNNYFSLLWCGLMRFDAVKEHWIWNVYFYGNEKFAVRFEAEQSWYMTKMISLPLTISWFDVWNSDSDMICFLFIRIFQNEQNWWNVRCHLGCGFS